MKVHLRIERKITPTCFGQQTVKFDWTNHVRDSARLCDMGIVRKKISNSLTDNELLVTCKNCIKRINKKGL